MTIRKRLTIMTAISAGLGMTALPNAAAQQTPAAPHDGHDHSADHNHAAHSLPPADMEGVFSELPDDHTLGSAQAPVTMIIYASVTCPHCSHWFSSVWPSLKASHVDTGKVRIVFREFPTAPAGLAYAGFLIANCAPEDQYFPVLVHQMVEQDALMEAAKAGNGKAAYFEVAKLAGMDSPEQMDACLADQDKIAKIDKSLDLARAGNIQSVPNFVINGQIYEGRSDTLPLLRYLDSLEQQTTSPLPKITPKP